MMRAAATFVLSCAGVIGVSAACGGRNECGAGTIEKGGVCVPNADLLTRCGAGAVLDAAAGACVPVSSCGEGTRFDQGTGTCVSASVCGPGTELDLVTGACAPQATCGPGTELNEALGVCEAVITCGDGSALDVEARRCVGPPPCTGGALLNPDTGACESDLVCGPAQVIIDDRCVTLPEELALSADFVEPAPDDNDPARGGAPIEVAVAPGDPQIVLVGTIGRIFDPTTGALSQDRDVWRLPVSAGAALRVRALSFGLDEPVFVVRGAGGYLRSSTVGVQAEPERELIVPRGGTLDIEVTAGAFVQTGVPTGSSSARYLLVIEPIELPAPAVIAPGASVAAPSTALGALEDLRDNVFAIDAAPGQVVVAELVGLVDALPVRAALFALGAGNRVVAESRGLDQGFPWIALRREGSEPLRLIVDWAEATAPLPEFQLAVFAVPSVADTVEARIARDGATLDIPHRSWGAFVLEVQAPQVLDVEIKRTGGTVVDPDVMVLKPSGSATFEDDDDFFFLTEPGPVTVVVQNEQITVADYQGAFLRMVGAELRELGPLGPGDETTVVGDDVVPGLSGLPDVWLRADLLAPAILEARLSLDGGHPSLSILDADGTSLRDHVVEEHGLLTSTWFDGAVPALVRLSPSAFGSALRPMVGWRLHVAARALPPFGDVEPNDDPEYAAPLGSLTERRAALGRISDGEVDLWTFDAAPGAGQAVRLRVESLNGNRNGSTIDDERLFVQAHDRTGVPAGSLPSISPPGLGASSHELHLVDGGELVVTIASTSYASGPVDYLIEAEVIDAAVEVEPNDSAPVATPASGVPAVVFAARDYGSDDDDVFALELPFELYPEESLVVAVDNLLSTSTAKLELLLERADGSEIARSVGSFPRVHGVDLQPGALVARVRRDPGSSTLPGIPYRLRVDVGRRRERAANDDSPETLPPFSGEGGDLIDGTVVSSVTNTATGSYLAGDRDRFEITAVPPLADSPAAGCVRVRVLNLSSTRTLVLERSDADPGTPPLDEDTVAELVLAPAEGRARVSVHDSYTFSAASDGDLAARATRDDYRLVAERTGPCEAEPNGDAATATFISEGDALLGHTRSGDVDVYAWQAPAVGAGEALVARARNLSDATALVGRLLSSGVPVAEHSGVVAELRLDGPRAAGLVHVEVTHSATSGRAGDLYAVEVLRE
ncbi:MAG: hypothetical protein A2138_26445 [Deltaproteobacteria bacterium RBG_16_71_12]|nr:MAG: hypothetical protein A2138_26445 [Deltaproteobacteria bacterium RBG_16_71_12]